MPRRNIKIFDSTGRRHIYDVDRIQATDMLARKVVEKRSEGPLTLRLAQPAYSANEKRGLFQSLHPGKANPIVTTRKNENRGRGRQLRGGKGGNFENALIAVAAETANEETAAAFEAWKPKMKAVPASSNADVVSDRAILFFPEAGSSR